MLKSGKKYKAIFMVMTILAIIGYLIYSGIRDTMVYYLTVSEALAKSPAELTETIKVAGTVTPGSVQWEPRTLDLTFTMSDTAAGPETGTAPLLAVDYQGAVPDPFKPGREVIVEGAYRGNGRFVATAIMPKCASKYE